MTLADRINELCAYHGSLRKACAALKISPSHLSRLRAGLQVNPGPELLSVLGVELAVPPAEVQYRKVSSRR